MVNGRMATKMGRYVDLSQTVTASYYDEEHEEWRSRRRTIEDLLDDLCDSYTTTDAVPPNMTAVSGLVDRFERILRDIRESKVDDSVCGMCEYDGAFIGQSGDWCNECPGFEKEDCFKLSDECRKRWVESAIDGVKK